ncbi:MAG TPA: SET domain-containing protein-lysine N-methyltransferase [Steroidobacteraceae bacterium]|nr:SET domain-containing protein-lysine N-methyltransferase [Steroidobacteraceae bacterium]
MKKTPPSPRRSKADTQAAPHHAHMRRAQKATREGAEENPYVTVRQSKIHGRGVYASRRIRKGTRIIEYVGDRISHEEADARYDAKPEDDGHTFLFVVDDDICIDAGVGGNAARFINHKCDANCETIIEDRRVFIEAIRTIEPGDELGYDYQLTWESTDDPEELKLYTCRCGAANCRGTMLDREPLDVKKRRNAKAKRQKQQKQQKQAKARNTAAAKTKTSAAGKRGKKVVKKAPPARGAKPGKTAKKKPAGRGGKRRSA